MTGRPPDHDLLGEPEQAAPSEEDERGADIFPTEEPPPADRYSADLPLEAPPSGLAADFVADLTQLYLNDIGQHALLTAPQELELARAMRAGYFNMR